VRLELPELVDRFRGRPLMTVTTPEPTPRMLEMLGAFADPALCVAVQPNPTLIAISDAFGDLRETKVSAVLAIGGGSVMDTAKLLATWSGLPLGVVPTTAGTGAEATEFATAYKGGVKQSVPCRVATFRVVDSAAALEMPPYLAACTGMDVLCHGLEAGWANGGRQTSAAFACQAVEQALEHLVPSVVDPTAKTRGKMLMAAFRAGQAINIAKTTAAHALSYELTTQHDIPHGHAVAMMMLRVLRMREERGAKAKVSAAEFEALMDAVGLDKKLPTPAREWRVDPGRLANDPICGADDVATLTEGVDSAA